MNNAFQNVSSHHPGRFDTKPSANVSSLDSIIKFIVFDETMGVHDTISENLELLITVSTYVWLEQFQEYFKILFILFISASNFFLLGKTKYRTFPS